LALKNSFEKSYLWIVGHILFSNVYQSWLNQRHLYQYIFDDKLDDNSEKSILLI